MADATQTRSYQVDQVHSRISSVWPVCLKITPPKAHIRNRGSGLGPSVKRGFCLVRGTRETF